MNSDAMMMEDPEVTAGESTSFGSPAVERFRSCRWHAEGDGSSEHCGHRDVLPFAGASGFNPEAWCPECKFYKLRRTPKKRHPDAGR